MDQASLPLIRKSKLRDLFSSIKKEFDDIEKARKLAEAKQAVELVNNVFENNDLPVDVGIINKTGNTKALSQAIGQVKGLNRAAMLISLDPETKKVIHQSYVPSRMVSSEFNATKWAQVITDSIGGKYGGNDILAQGSGDLIENVDEAVELAKSFASKLKI